MRIISRFQLIMLSDMKKILIIEDSKEDFLNMRELLKGTYEILPENFEEMSACIEYPQHTRKDIVEFAIQQINDNYKELRAILCDIKLGKDSTGGNRVVEAIKNHKILGSPIWTILVPVITITHYADKQQSMMDSGAIFSLSKDEDKDHIFGIIKANANDFDKKLNTVCLSLVENKTDNNEICTIMKKTNNKKVFIVHGRNKEVKLEVARVLEHLKLEPIILHERPNLGKTLIEKFETNGSDVGFAIILLTADDVGRLNKLEEKDNKPRARQNVVFEMGYFMGRLSRSHVFILREDEIEEPSDLSGIVYNKLSENWQLDLVKELKECGYDVDANYL